MSRPFHFKAFSISQENAAMKVGTDGVILGAWADNSICSEILDLGCGTGLISLMMAQRFPQSLITSIDIDEKAIEDARINFNNSKWNRRIDLMKTNLHDLGETKKFDLIVCNPPFFESDSRSPNSHRATARSGDELSFLSWVQKAKKLLTPSGVFAFIYPIKAWNRIKSDIVGLGFNIQRYREVKPIEEKDAHRVLVQLSANDVKRIDESDLTIEISRHRYTEEYIVLTRDFYLKMT